MNRTPRLEGKVVLVTGAFGGIGSAVCRELIREGARLVAADLAEAAPPADISASCELILDGKLEEDSNRFVGKTKEQCGSLDAVVNLVGMNVFADLLDLSTSDWDLVLRTNLTSAFSLSVAAARAMASQGRGGSIVHFSSTTSIFGSPGQAAYAAAKAALNSLVKSMAVEWSPLQIRVNAVSPIMTRTRINADWLDEDAERQQNIAARIPLGRLGQPEDYAALCALLISDDLPFMTGQTVFIDGGASLVHPLLGSRHST